MVGNVSQFTLQPMANTKHKFPMIEGATDIPCEIKSTVALTPPCKYSKTSLIRTPVIRTPPLTGQLILSILC